MININWLQIYYKLLNLLLSILVKSKSIPKKPVLELKFNLSCPIIYVLLCNSNADLLTLRSQTIEHNLPDPLEPIVINSFKLPRYIFINKKPSIFTYSFRTEESCKLFHDYLNLHNNNPDIDIQIVPISVMFGRYPGYERKNIKQSLHLFGSIKKIFSIICFGRDSFVCFLPSVSLRQILIEHGNDKIIAKKLARMARIYFFRQRLATIGPYLPIRSNLFNKLLVSKRIFRAIEDEVRNKKISYKKAKQNTLILIKEIAANFSYGMVRLANKILDFTWNYLYRGINVYNIERIYKLIYSGHKIVYIPCHRSHMDYLLLSYVLYNNGLVPPHIAAGINLNFWPAGLFLRRLGAFFIRRTFRGNKLYSTVFREYLGELFNRGYSIEYFIEGSRSRTGLLINPKTGTISMTIQAILHSNAHHITLVPIYIGYEYIIEIDTYIKELRGSSKDKESLLKMLCALSKLRNLGRGYINFGEPLSLVTWLNEHVPKWRTSINSTKYVHPVWLSSAASNIATNLMIRINNASTVNAVNLCSTALLAARNYSLTRKQLTEQLRCYLDLMRNVPYSNDSIVPSVSINTLINHALELKKFKVIKDVSDDNIILPRKEVILMNYYRNNIVHMLILPSLIAAVITQYCHIPCQKLLLFIEIIYPMLKAEFFLHWNKKELTTELYKLIDELLRQQLIFSKDKKIFINPSNSHILKLLAVNVHETLQRYVIIFWLLNIDPFIKPNMLKKKSYIVAQRLSALYKINSLAFLDKTTFNTLVATLYNEGYISDIRNIYIRQQPIEIYRILSKLISSNMRYTIENTDRN